MCKFVLLRNMSADSNTPLWSGESLFATPPRLHGSVHFLNAEQRIVMCKISSENPSFVHRQFYILRGNKLTVLTMHDLKQQPQLLDCADREILIELIHTQWEPPAPSLS